MNLMLYVLFILGFAVLIKGGDFLVTGSSSVAKRFGLSDMVVGLTVVSFGTSAPELVVNIISSLNGSSEIAIGNVIGSNISNVLLIVGVTAIICPLPIKRDTLLSEIPFSLSAAVLVGFLANSSLFGPHDKQLHISRGDGLILLYFFFLFLAYVFRIANESVEKGEFVPEQAEVLPLSRSVGLIVLGMLGLFIGGKWVVDGAIGLAGHFGLSESFVGLTIIAIGTSLPELVTSILAATRHSTDIAVGNAIGSNIFNALWILGLSAVIKPLPFNMVNNTDLLVLIMSSSFLVLSLATGRRNAIDRGDGILFILIYIGYIAFCIHRG